MAEVVDSIIAELIARDNGYTATFEKATSAAKAHTAALKELAAVENGSQASATRTASTRKRASADEAAATKQAAAEIKRAAQESAAAQRAAAKAASDAVKAAEREKQAALKATQAEQAKAAATAEAAAAKEIEAANAAAAAAEREAAARARLSAMVDRSLSAQAAAGAGTAPIIAAEGVGADLAARQTAEMRGTVVPPASAGNAVAEKEVNAAMVDQLGLSARLTAARDEDRIILQDQIFEIQQFNRYVTAGLTKLEASAKVEQDLLAIETLRTRNAEKQAAAQAAALEKQIRAQSGQVSKGIGLFTATLIGGVTVGELSSLNDEYIRLSNSLKVAGVSALDFDTVQNHLLQTSVRTGANIGALADTYRSIALASRDLGASQADILRVTDAMANSLKITGASGSAAQAAILQLGHAFETGRVTAREFNGLALNAYPILQAAAAGSAEYGGSVAKLREALIAGDLSSKTFFADILAGSDQLKARAAGASLTTAQGFTALNNALIVYFGTADKAYGLSAALGTALQTLASNLDIVIPAIAAIGTALAVGYVTRVTAAAVATRGLGASILGAFGGPVGLTITAVTLALASFAAEAAQTAAMVRETDAAYAQMQDRLKATATNAAGASGGIKGVGTDALGAIPQVNTFAGAVGNLAQQLYNQARAARAARIEMLQQQLQASQQKESDLAARTPAGVAGAVQDAFHGLGHGNIADAARADKDYIVNRFGNLVTGGDQDRGVLRAYGEQVKISQDLQNQIAAAKSAPITAQDIPGGAPKAGDTGNGTGTGTGTGASADAARKRAIRDDRQFDSALRQEQSEELAAQADITGDAAARAQVEKARLKFQADELAKEIASKGPGKDAPANIPLMRWHSYRRSMPARRS